MAKRRRRDEQVKLEQEMEVLPAEILPIQMLGPSLARRIDARQVADYLIRYIERYRQTYAKFIDPPPAGHGYPDLHISPYLYSTELNCYLADDGYAIWDGWEVADPTKAIRVAPPDSRTEAEIRALEGRIFPVLSVQNLSAQGAIRFCRMPGPTVAITETFKGTTRLNVRQYATDIQSLLLMLTLGCNVIAEPMSTINQGPTNDFWVPNTLRNATFCSQGDVYARFYHYLQVSRYLDESAWEPRTIWARVRVDLVQDFLSALDIESRPDGATIGYGRYGDIAFDRLSLLGRAIDRFQELLKERGDAPESVFHDFLASNPVLLDAYGTPVSKPRWHYPEGESPLGKTYVEPDFVMKYHGGGYKLIELERPSKRLATTQGQPRAEVTQATFQIAEWRAFIDHHYPEIKDKLPHITSRCPAMVVISRTSEKAVGAGRDFEAYLQLLNANYPGIEFYTYDDIVIRAREMYARLSSLPV
jgi:hypothetical protein